MHEVQGDAALPAILTANNSPVMQASRLRTGLSSHHAQMRGLRPREGPDTEAGIEAFLAPQAWSAVRRLNHTVARPSPIRQLPEPFVIRALGRQGAPCFTRLVLQTDQVQPKGIGDPSRKLGTTREVKRHQGTARLQLHLRTRIDL